MAKKLPTSSVTQVTAYKTSDGKLFESPFEADEHDFRISTRYTELKQANVRTDGGHEYRRVDGVTRKCELCSKTTYRDYGGYDIDKSQCRNRLEVL